MATSLAYMVVLFPLVVEAGKVYKVGDSEGWIVNTDYKKWAAKKNFHVGDTIVFEYNNQLHDVLQVSKKNFSLCNPSTPIRTYKSGNDSITIKSSSGHYYYICGFLGHCRGGQKVKVRVTKSESSTIAPLVSPSSSPTPSPSPLESSTTYPASTPSSECSNSSSAPTFAPNANGASLRVAATEASLVVVMIYYISMHGT